MSFFSSINFAHDALNVSMLIHILGFNIILTFFLHVESRQFQFTLIGALFTNYNCCSCMLFVN
jgi:Ca2+/Na+ antiporter